MHRHLGSAEKTRTLQHHPPSSSPELLHSYIFFFHLKYEFCINNIILIMILYTCLLLTTRTHGLVTDGNAKLCCQGFILALFQSTTAN